MKFINFLYRKTMLFIILFEHLFCYFSHKIQIIRSFLPNDPIAFFKNSKTNVKHLFFEIIQNIFKQ